MISDNKITEIYCKADDFCKIFQEFNEFAIGLAYVDWFYKK